MKSIPLISIITPVYNVENYLSECIDSIIAQTFQMWELLLVDDGSTDRSRIICDEYEKKDSRIHVIHKKNSGQADSRNGALLMAKADLIGFVDSDDWIEPDMYERLFKTMQECHTDISICGYFLNYRDKVIASCSEKDIRIYSREEALALILEDVKIKSFPCDKLFKKELLTPLFPSSFFYEDYAVLFKWILNASSVAFIPTPLYHYRQRQSSTRNDGDPKKEYHFFLAELERYNYLISHRIFSENQVDSAHKLINVALKQAKNIAKYSSHNEVGILYIKKIIVELEKLPKQQYKGLKWHKAMKLKKLLHFPSFYFYEIRIKYKLLVSKKKKQLLFP